MSDIFKGNQVRQHLTKRPVGLPSAADIRAGIESQIPNNLASADSSRDREKLDEIIMDSLRRKNARES